MQTVFVLVMRWPWRKRTHARKSWMKMKSIKLMAITVLAAVLGSERAKLAGQASFNCANYDRNGLFQVVVNAPVYDWSGQLLWGPEWRAELFGGATPNALAPAVDLMGGVPYPRMAVSFYRPGYFGSADLLMMSIASVPPRGWAWLQVKVWDAGLGASFEEAFARGSGGYGSSEVFYAQGSDPTPPGMIPPAPLIRLRSFSIVQEIPEPSAGVLLVLALAGLVWFRPGNRGRGSPEHL